MELSELITELKRHLDNTTGMNRSLLSTAINNLEIINRDVPILKRNWTTIEPNTTCPECQPGRPCYGHGHY